MADLRKILWSFCSTPPLNVIMVWWFQLISFSVRFIRFSKSFLFSVHSILRAHWGEIVPLPWQMKDCFFSGIAWRTHTFKAHVFKMAKHLVLNLQRIQPPCLIVVILFRCSANQFVSSRRYHDGLTEKRFYTTVKVWKHEVILYFLQWAYRSMRGLSFPKVFSPTFCEPIM